MRALVAAALVMLPSLAHAGDKKPALTTGEEEAVVAAYHALKSPEPQSRKIDQLPEGELQRIEVSERIRSASFGHRTWLLVPAGGKRFYVEYGRSTNTPAAFFGPFDVAPAAPAPTRSNGPPPGKTQ